MKNDEFDVSVVVIGRNEGLRLTRCLESVREADWQGLRFEVVYVDSHSTDGSTGRARRLGARVFDLGDAKPCAAAGRNIGWRAALAPLVLFLDGDTVLNPGFVARALPLFADPKLVAVWGHRRESNPGQSLYTRVLDLDWVFAPGRVDYFGGDALVRRAALDQVGGFDDGLVAGEEPELCRRLRAVGWQIEHIDAPMTLHDLAITDGRAWWKRAERAGLAYAQVAARFEGTKDPFWLREARRNRIHARILLALPLVGLAMLLLWPPAALLLVLAIGAVWFRSTLRCVWKCPGDHRLAALYALHSHLQQIPILAGQRRWRRLQREQRAPELMEYHAVPPKASSTADKSRS